MSVRINCSNDSTPAGGLGIPFIHEHSPLQRIHAPAAYRSSMNIKKPAPPRRAPVLHELLLQRVTNCVVYADGVRSLHHQAVGDAIIYLEHH